MILDHCEVVCRTDDLPHDEWLAERRKGLGGSDASVVMGANKYRNLDQLLADKLGTGTDTAGPSARWGSLLEPIVAQVYAEEFGAAVVHWPVLLRSKAHPWMLANLDGLIVQPSQETPGGAVTQWEGLEPPQGILGVYEGKSTGIVTRGNRKGWNGGVPAEYDWQGAHYAAVTGLVRVTFVCLIGGLGLVVRERDYEDHGQLIEREKQFWQLVQKRLADVTDS